MLRVMSVCWPFDHNRYTVEAVLAHLVATHVDEVCIRTPVYYDHYDSPTDPTYHDRLASGARALGMEVSLWPIVSLAYPEKMAESVWREYDRYKPVRIVLDAERRWVNLYGSNTKTFLLSLGIMPCPVGLGSYRRPSLQPQIRWQTWLTTKVGGKYVISFQGAQLYPIGWLQPRSVVHQFRLDINSHEDQHRSAGRSDISWLPFMPAFSEGLDPYGNMWYPRVDTMIAAIEYMQIRLGRRLVGLNWWSMDQDLASDPKLRPLYEHLAGNVVPVPSYMTTARAGYSNVRAGPGLSYPVVGHLVGGQKVTVVLEQAGWAKIHPTEDRWVSLTRITNG